ncbi:MAG: hypothetical protein JO108_01900 [Acidobacteriaceae bacterium]|nr:hypothetical protein [Acidobacteriaceae bacterium]
MKLTSHWWLSDLNRCTRKLFHFIVLSVMLDHKTSFALFLMFSIAYKPEFF